MVGYVARGREVVGKLLEKGRSERSSGIVVSSLQQASSVVLFGFGDELEGLEKIFGLDFAGSRFVGRSGVLKLS
jgi:hypothetical protein